MNLFAFALRNITRSRARVWVTIGSMAFAGTIMIYYAALMEGFIRTTEKNAVAMELASHGVTVVLAGQLDAETGTGQLQQDLAWCPQGGDLCRTQLR